jgi:acetolactate synthase-1/2/3 large subunit
MTTPISRRAVLKGMAAAAGLAAVPARPPEAEASPPGWLTGLKTGARALVEALQAEGTQCVFGIPGAQENELWDQMKSRHLPYLLVTHELSAAIMADGAARSTGCPGVLCVVPGPGITNALTGLGEALLDSVPVVCIAGDVARGVKYRPFQVHELPATRLLEPVTKAVLEVHHVSEVPAAVRRAFQLARAGEPGPVGVVVPYHLLLESCKYHDGPLAPAGLPFDENAFAQALALLSDQRRRVGIYAGLGCMDHAAELTRVAEVLQAPVATSVSGKGSISECHFLAVGWGYGPQGTRAAERAFKEVDLVLAIGVRFSEVSTGFYSVPPPRWLIHVDACAANLGRVHKPDVCVHADAGLFLDKLLEAEAQLCRPANAKVQARIRHWKAEDAREHVKSTACAGVDPMLFLLALRRASCADALVFVDVAAAEHLAAEAFTVVKPRTYFNPADNQAMGWSIPAAIGAQKVNPGRQVVTVTGDGCFLMTALELATAAREALPVKCFVLDNQTYHYMQILQNAAYRRTTATVLPRFDYSALAQALGVGYAAIPGTDLEAEVRGVLALPGPVLATLRVDYGKRKIRWIEAVRGKFTRELSTEQKVRFAARLGARSLQLRPQND